jgi:thiol-disulfide isomerase/thioredoxin
MKVIKIGAIWCAGCLVMKPRWAEIETELPWLKTEYLDYDSDRTAVKELKVNAILPVAIFLDDYGKELIRLQGEQSKKKLLRIIEEYKDK